MKMFVCRVELRGKPGVLTYVRLHAAMEKIGFKRSFPGEEGRRYDMPHGMYVSYSRSTLDLRNTRVMTVVKPIWEKFLVLTMEVEDMTGFLLFSQED